MERRKENCTLSINGNFYSTVHRALEKLEIQIPKNKECFLLTVKIKRHYITRATQESLKIAARWHSKSNATKSNAQFTLLHYKRIQEM